MSDNKGLVNRVNGSAVLTVIGIILLFLSSIIITLVAPYFIDNAWTNPASDYQVQMYEVGDASTYISTSAAGEKDLQVVNHLAAGSTLLAFTETEGVRIIAPQQLERFVTANGEPILKLTHHLLMLREPEGEFLAKAERLQNQLQSEWESKHSDWRQKGLQRPRFEILELYALDTDTAFSVSESDGVLEDWVDEDFTIIDGPNAPHHSDVGVLYVNNPREYRVKFYKFGADEGWRYDPTGEPIASLEELRGDKLGFLSRKELIELGEHTFAIEGCWYCHTDQTRTLVQDTVLNGSESFPAPPSSSTEYIYQKITFAGTRRIGLDISRVGVKRPSRDWHKSHFWSPKTASVGTIMPAFRHFFDDDPRGTSVNPYGVPNYKFEAVFQYLMTKGTRITSPTQAWWNGKDPVRTIDIIEGRRGIL